ncbi:PaaI family thioesterase [Parapusillimonas granuli]|uniref:PaaI family thioesterase n=1 Tax=Parapusillimonas granuli TaxID=380911 RepID=A0A853FY51_9BURK|nr:PaaI family thioesterase [Parapusillimonas granuli]MBB5216099.1 uncharacterized protein (TIGR00369 family) [Parapusillimonas granuli]MEB2400376.1 PaaI family thioesterase [Alcaligenaceae bacterium]NYT47780.1 PaaI family thioesterase [Parapusillimonas granuli]
MRFEDGSFFGIRAPMIDRFGIKPNSMSDGNTASAILPFLEENCNVHGTVSGPAIMALLDFAMAASARAHAPLAHTVLTIDLSIKFIKPADSDLYADCRCESRGRSMCFATGIVFNERGEKIAMANGVFKLVAGKGC